MTIKYGKRKGLVGPIEYPNGQVVYFDPIEKLYWDPASDFYLSDEEITALKMSLFNTIIG